MKKIFLSICLLLLTVLPTFAQRWLDSTEVNFKINSNGDLLSHKFYLWYPSGTNVLQGILLVSARGVGYNNGPYLATQPIFRKAAADNKLAIVVVQNSNDGGIVTSFNPLFAHADSLLKALAILSNKSSHPEIENAPLIPFGHSMGGNFSRQIGYWNPDRIAGIISYRIATTNTPPTWQNTPPYNTATNNLSKVPHLIVSGEVEGPDINNNMGDFYAEAARSEALARRAQGELVHHVIEMNTSHSTLTEKMLNYMSLFIAKVVNSRIPANSNASTGPVTLNVIPENSGWLGKANVYNDFNEQNYSISAFTAPSTTPAESFWLFDQPMAEAWKTFHTTAMTLSITPTATALAPYCNGQSAISVAYNTVGSGIAYNPDNVFRVEMSTIRGDFDLFFSPPRVVGYLRSTQPSGTIPITIPDNLQFAQAIGVGSPQRYRFKVVASTNRALQSMNSGEIPNINICTPQNLYLSSLPGSYSRKPGDSISIDLYRNTSFTLGASNTLTLQLSDSTGNFANATDLATLPSTIPASGSTAKITMRAKLPENTPNGIGYRLRVSASDPATISTTNGGFITVSAPSLATGLQKTSLTEQGIVVYPNPGKGLFYIKLSDVSNATFMVYDITGKQVGSEINQVGNSESHYALRLVNNKPGLYMLVAKQGNKKQHIKFVNQ